MIGRRTELETIGRTIDAARGGRSGVLVLRGVPGIGKTALLEQAVEEARDFRVLRAEGVDAESELAFAGLHQLLWPLTALVERLPSSQRTALEAVFGADGRGVADRFAVAAGALGLLADAAEERPVLCAVDDAQWLDRPSTEALGFVARRVGAEPIALLIAIRESAPVPAGLARFSQLALGGLAPDASRELLASTAELAPADRDRVLEASGGNPLALLELPRGPLGTAASGEMGSVERSFADRISTLPARTRDAILLAAADDDPDGATALRSLAAASVTVADLAPAEATGLLWVDGGRVAFRHPLVRSAAYGLATFDERRRAHAALAATLSSPADADRRAWHRASAAAAPDPEVASDLARSAERARARGGHAAAGAALERAARLTDEEPLRAARLVAAAEAARLAGDMDHAAALAAEALMLAGEPETTAEATAIRGAIRAHRGELAAGEQDLRAAAGALESRHPRRALRIGLLAAETSALDGRHGHAGATGRWAGSLDVGDGAADRALVAFAAAMAELFAGETAQARAGFAGACELAARSADPQALIWAATGAVYVGDIAAARRAFAEAVALARERGAVGTVAFGVQLSAYVELLEGRFAVAATHAAEGLTLAEETGDDAAAAHCRALLAWRAAVRGEEDETRSLAADALEWAAPQPRRVAAESAHRALALLDLGAGRFDAALDRLSELHAPGAHPARRLLGVGDLVEAAVSCGRAAEAREPLAALTAWADATGSAWGAATVAGAAVQLAPDAESAEAAYATAAPAFAEIALPFDRGRIELRLGEHLRRARRRVDSRRHLRAALDLFAQTGAVPWERRAAAELRATGETARRRDSSTLDELTPREGQIARLVAEGATNRDIAGRLFLSPRTVEYHLRKVFQKLGVASRTQLAGLDW